jgi:hypothetical protein
MNHLYSHMGTGKWFVADDELKGRVENAGFAVLDISPAPLLDMDSMDLGERYGLNGSQRADLGREIEQFYSPGPEIFASFEGGFRAHLRFCIFTCQAV